MSPRGQHAVDPELKNIELEVGNTAAGFDGNVSGGNVPEKIDIREIR